MTSYVSAMTRQYYEVQRQQIVEPEFYLRARLKKKQLDNRYVLTMTSHDYVKNAIANIEEQLNSKGMRLPTRVSTPMASRYHPETNSSNELPSGEITTFQEYIGILRCAIEIDRVDILTEVSMLSAYQASPREGHLEQVYRIFVYLKKKPKLTLYFDPQEPGIDHAWFEGVALMFSKNNTVTLMNRCLESTYFPSQEEGP